jgi:hypothetical protein
VRRCAPVAAVLAGLVLFGVGLAGVARVDGPLRAAAAQPPSHSAADVPPDVPPADLRALDDRGPQRHGPHAGPRSRDCDHADATVAS